MQVEGGTRMISGLFSLLSALVLFSAFFIVFAIASLSVMVVGVYAMLKMIGKEE